MLFRIRKEQVETFSRRLEDQFIDRTVAHLHATFPGEVGEQGLDDEALKQLCRRGLADSRRHSVVNEADVERYIECMLLLGPGFDADPRYPWAGQAINRDDLDGEAKMDLIDDHLIFDFRAGC